MAIFDKKHWNDAVFQKYMQKVPNLKINSLVKNGILQNNPSLKARLVDGVGGNLLVEPIKGLLDGDYVNYDGNTNITTSSRNTYLQKKVVVGRAKGWQEKDFSTELTGEDFMKGIAGEVAEYWDGVDQETILAILKGIFSMSDTAGEDFVEKHTSNIANEDVPNVGASTLNSAIQKASGDNKGIYKLAFMHSVVATNLENLQLLAYMTYNDGRGMERELGMATWNGRLVIIDDEMPVIETEDEYELTADTDIVSGKTYYTRSGSEGSYVYTPVVSPVKASLGSYYEFVSEAHTEYTTYVLGANAFEYCDCGAKVPSEVSRDPKTDGGIDMLYTRQRKLFAPKWISWIGDELSPAKTDLEDGSNWEIVNDHDSTSATYVNHKAIPFVRIISRG